IMPPCSSCFSIRKRPPTRGSLAGFRKCPAARNELYREDQEGPEVSLLAPQWGDGRFADGGQAVAGDDLPGPRPQRPLHGPPRERGADLGQRVDQLAVQLVDPPPQYPQAPGVGERPLLGRVPALEVGALDEPGRLHLRREEPAHQVRVETLV